MGIALGMKELTQDIASSHEDRARMISEIKEEAKQAMGEAQKIIKGFQTSRGKAGAQLREDLARNKASRKSDVKKMLGDAQGLIRGFQTSQQKESAQLRRELAQGVAGRRSEVNAILGDARQAIKSFQSQRKEAGSKLRGELAQSQSSRESEVGELIKGAQDLVKDIGKSRQETGKNLRKGLAKGRADWESGVKEMRSEFHKSQEAVRADIDEARAAWRELTRGKPAKKARAKMPPKVEAPKAEEEVAAEEVPDVEAKLLAAIREHPQGITLTEVAESLGVAPIVLGRASKKLLDEGKIRKEDKAYFPLASE